MRTPLLASAFFMCATLSACNQTDTSTVQADAALKSPAVTIETKDVVSDKTSPSRFDIYAEVELKPDLSALSDNQKQMVVLLIEAAKVTDDIFWQQVWGDREALLSSIKDPKTNRFADYNYGPWDRLDSDKPFIDAFGDRPKGAQFYPRDMTKAEFEAWQQPPKT